MLRHSHRLPSVALALLLMSCAGASSPAASPAPAHPPAEAAAPHEHGHGQHGHGQHEHGHGQHGQGQRGRGEHGHGEHGHGQHGLHKDFSNAEAFSAHFDDPARDAWQKPEAVLDLMRIVPGSTVADLGAGTGYFVAGLARRVGSGGKVLALDVEPKMVEFLERRVREQKLENVSPVRVTPDDPGLAPGSVSRVLIVNTWHHIDQRPSYAKKLAASLAPDGEIWIVDFTLDADEGPPAEYRLPAEQVVRELTAGGLHAQVVEPEPLAKQYVVRATR